jgi:hypothetical protein
MMGASPEIAVKDARSVRQSDALGRPACVPRTQRRTSMPKTSKAKAEEHVTLEGYEGHFTELDTGYTVGFETYSADADIAEFFRGLPDDRCQCSHWGYVFKGKITYKTADGDETFQAGDAYHVGPGHTPVLHAGTEVIEFSPTDDLRRTIEVVTKNMEAATG